MDSLLLFKDITLSKFAKIFGITSLVFSLFISHFSPSTFVPRMTQGFIKSKNIASKRLVVYFRSSWE